MREKADKLEAMTVDESYTIEIDLSKLPDFGDKNYKDRLRSLGFSSILDEKRGAVYYFHVPETVERQQILNAMLNFKTDGQRVISSISHVENRDYQVFYIGSFKSHFYNRFTQHLGYNSKGTGALQLIHWAKPLFSKIKFTYFPIDYSPLALHVQMEIAMCKALTPMIGKIERDRIK